MSLDLPQLFKFHVFMSGQQRPPEHPRGSCGAAGAMPLWERLGARMQAFGNPEAAMTVAGCMGFCQTGPVVVVYPEGIWYAPKTAEDIDGIADSHLGNGKPLERLVILPRV